MGFEIVWRQQQQLMKNLLLFYSVLFGPFNKERTKKKTWQILPVNVFGNSRFFYTILTIWSYSSGGCLCLFLKRIKKSTKVFPLSPLFLFLLVYFHRDFNGDYMSLGNNWENFLKMLLVWNTGRTKKEESDVPVIVLNQISTLLFVSLAIYTICLRVKVLFTLKIVLKTLFGDIIHHFYPKNFFLCYYWL